MKKKDIFKQSLKNLQQQGLRSWLTVLGIVIGVASVIAIISIGSGLQQSINSQTEGLAQRVGVVTPGSGGFSFGLGGGGGPQASEDDPVVDNVDLRVIQASQGVDVAYGQVDADADVSNGDLTAPLSVTGVNPRDWREANTDVELAEGRYLTSSDRNSILIGWDIAKDLYDENISLNSPLNIDNQSFTVVGIISEDSDRQATSIIMTPDPARGIAEDLETGEYSSIGFIVEEEAEVDNTVERVEDNLMDSRSVTEDTQDFSVTSLGSQLEQITNITTTLNYFVAGIAAISLLVGAVGIANTMYMSVMERTKEIGTFKALGTTRREILELFITESALIGLVGGFIGVSLGFLLSGIIGVILSIVLTDIPASTYISPFMVIASLIFAVVMGVASGTFPALKAARLEPVEALRSE
jgi:putative ABC transport system permease protein